MSQDKTRELAMDHAAKLRRAEPHLPLVRLFVAATLIGLTQGTLVVLDSVAAPRSLLHGLFNGPINVLAKVSLVLLVLDTAATGFTLVCLQAGDVRSPSTEILTKRWWFW